MACAPGVATLTEAYAALAAGANMLKLFPAEALPPHVLKAWRAVHHTAHGPGACGRHRARKILRTYAAAGASGFGLGSALYRPGDDQAADVAHQGRCNSCTGLAWRPMATRPPAA